MSSVQVSLTGEAGLKLSLRGGVVHFERELIVRVRV